MSIWITDPKSKEKSVSLTLVALSTFMYVAVIIANVLGVEVSAGLIQQFWFGSSALYFGRRVKFSKDGSLESGRKKDV